MSKFAKKVAVESHGSSIPQPPAKCGVFGCDGDSFLAMASCRVGTGDAVTGVLSLTKTGAWFSRKVAGKGWQNTSDFTFIRWIARCTPCYMRENRLDRVLEDAVANA